MACTKPLRVKLLQPQLIDGQYLYSVPVNCGKCDYCKKQRINGWAFRLEQEEKYSNNVYFSTLTYNSENIPYCKIDKDAKIRTKEGLQNKYSEEDIMSEITKVPTLNKSDVQKFIKRLRIIEEEKYGKKTKIIDGKEVAIKDVFFRKLHNIHYDYNLKLKYYAVGEYGTKNRRPHYHVVIFNLYDQDSIDEAWQMGDVDTKEAHTNSIVYLLKYLEKETKHYKYIFKLNLQTEFSLQSKGIGACYITPNTIRYHLNNYDNNVVTLKNGAKAKIPRYIHEKIYKQRKKENRHEQYEIEQHRIDLYLRGLYKHIKMEADKKEAAMRKAYKHNYENELLRRAKNSLSIRRLKKRD